MGYPIWHPAHTCIGCPHGADVMMTTVPKALDKPAPMPTNVVERSDMHKLPLFNVNGRLIGSIELTDEAYSNIRDLLPGLTLSYEYTKNPNHLRSFALIFDPVVEGK